MGFMSKMSLEEMDRESFHYFECSILSKQVIIHMKNYEFQWFEFLTKIFKTGKHY